jgi:WD40 repeat protein
MLTEESFHVPEIDALLSSFEHLLRGFDPTSLTYLDGQGNWRKYPSSIRQRISNELWFEIWEARSCGDYPGRTKDYPERIKDLVLPFVRDREHWALARSLSYGTLAGKDQGNLRDRESCSRELAELLAVCKVLLLSIEYEAYRKNAGLYVADWDSRGKAKRARYLEESEKLLDELRQRLREAETHLVSRGRDQVDQGRGPASEGSGQADAPADSSNQECDRANRQRMTGEAPNSLGEPELQVFLRLSKLLDADEGSIFSRTVLIIAEEERVRDDLKLLLADLKDSRQKDEARDFISEQLNVTRGVAASVPRILLRPCIEILTNSEIDISTGMQFEASGILGKLRDVRSAEALLSALDVYPPRYTDLRANLIYALGNLKQKKALNRFVPILEGPESVRVHPSGASEYDQPLLSEKCEAIWALGKLGSEATDALPALVRYTGISDKEARLYLAWALGTIGSGQKEKYGGMDAGILTALMNLLTAKQSSLLEEVAFALKKLGLPDFLHTLYLRDLAAVPILSLKPSSTGLYELSETLLHLASIKKPIVMAVTGDSGTGKTYFCQTIANGFSGIKSHEILYLMRDRIGDRTLDRILGIKWLRRHNAAQFCEGYPLTEDEDKPDEFFDEFMRQHADKKLIILDGWRDQAYFHQVVRTFYEKGYLDVLVKFQTTFSTRRINLEEREGVLEKVKLHLPLVEDPAIEETPFYREGAVLIYNLDNSISSRLNREEILQVFERKKVDAWADQIRIGRFTRGVRPLRIDDEVLPYHFEDIIFETREISIGEPISFSPSEASFSRILNESIDRYPNLLQTIKLDTIAVNRTAFYTHGQIACCGYDGRVAVLTGLNDRILYAGIHDTEVVDLSVVGGDIYSVDRGGYLKATSFHTNTTANIGKSDSPALFLASHRDPRIATAHLDGTVRLWNILAGTVTVLKAHKGPVFSLAVDRHGRIYSGGEDKQLRVWDVEAGKVRVFQGHKSPINAMNIYPDGRIVTGTQPDDGFEKGETAKGAKLRIIDIGTGACKIFHACDEGTIATINVYFDGRLFVGVRLSAGEAAAQAGAATFQEERSPVKTPSEDSWEGASIAPGPGRGTAIVFDPRPDFRCYNLLEGHRLETRGCVTMGPRLITCGSESRSERTLRIWGTASYVEVEHEKSRLMPETTSKPPYYRSLF